MSESDVFSSLTCREKDRFAVKFRCRNCGSITWVKGKDLKIEEKFMNRRFMNVSYVWHCPVCQFGTTSIDFAPVETIFDE